MFLEILKLFLLPLMLFNSSTVFGNSFHRNCLPGYKQGTELAFTEDPGNLAITCTNAFVELSCCIKGYTLIKWYKQRQRQGKWREMQLSPIRFYQENDRNQTLTLQNPLVSVDDTSYMCVAENGRSHLNHTFSLEIRDCGGQRPPSEILRPRKKVIQRPLNSNVSITCVGFFGTEYEKIQAMIMWGRTMPGRTIGNDTEWWNPETAKLGTKDKNINLTYSETAAHITSAIRISNITEKDYGNYTCCLLSSRESKHVTVELKQSNDPVIAAVVDDRWKYALICVMAVLVLLVLLALLLYCFLLDIKLLYRDRFAKAVNDGKKFDALVVCNNNDKNDRDFVTKILYKVLEEQYGYKLFIEERNALGGEPEANAWLTRANSSRCIIFVMSPALLDEQWVDYVYFSMAKQIDTPKIFLIHRPVQDSDWKSYQAAFKKTFQMAKRKIKWPQEKSSGTENVSFKDKVTLFNWTNKISKTSDLSVTGDTSSNDKLSSKEKITATSPSAMNMNNNNSSVNKTPRNSNSNDESMKKGIISRREQKFWKKIRLALPKPMSSSNKSKLYISLSQDSTPNSSPMISPDLSSLRDAYNV